MVESIDSVNLAQQALNKLKAYEAEKVSCLFLVLSELVSPFLLSSRPLFLMRAVCLVVSLLLLFVIR